MSEIQDDAYTELCLINTELNRENGHLKFLLREERKTIAELARLLQRAADALDCYNLDHLQDALIRDLRDAGP